MSSVTLCLLYFALFVLCSSAEKEFFQIYDGPTHDIKLMSQIGSRQACDANFLVLKTNYCLATINASASVVHINDKEEDVPVTTYNMVDLSCPPELVGVTTIDCNEFSCLAYNPNGNIVYKVSNEGVVFGNIPLPPQLRNTTHVVFERLILGIMPSVRIVVYDLTNFAINSSLYPELWAIQFSLPGYTAPLITPGWSFLGFLNVHNVTGLYLFPVDSSLPNILKLGVRTTNFLSIPYFASIAFSPAQRTSPPLASTKRIGEGVIKTSTDIIANDNQGDLLVYQDNAILIFNEDYVANRDLVGNISVPYPVTYMASSRGLGIILNDDGIYMMKEELTYEVISNNKTCETDGTIVVNVTGGRFPYIVALQPEGVSSRKRLEYPGTVTFSINAPFTEPVAGITLVDEEVDNSLVVQIFNPQVTKARFVDSSVISPKSGNLSYEFNMAQGRGLTLSCANRQTCMSASVFEYLEFSLNIGKGGQTFQIDCSTRTFLRDFKPGDLETDTWHTFRIALAEITMHHSSLLANGINLCEFKDTANVFYTEPIYIDDMKLIPHTWKPPTRKVYITDTCKTPAYHTKLVPFKYEPFSVDILSTPVSCNVDTSVSSSLTQDGTLSVNVTQGGVGPFIYSWYDGSSTSTITNKKVMNANITVYDNFLNTSFSEYSEAINVGDEENLVFDPTATHSRYTLKSTRNCHSPPYCIAFAMVNLEKMVFQVPEEISSLEYASLEYWINGGDIAGQKIDVIATRQFNIDTNGQRIIKNDVQHLKLYPNTWQKITLDITPNQRNYGLIGFSSGLVPTDPQVQPIIYIDDIVLIPKAPTLTVTDKTGCQAFARTARVLSSPPMEQETIVNNAKCFGASDGSVMVAMDGGQPPYSFKWSSSTRDTSLLNGLTEGPVQFDVTDSYGCQYIKTGNVVILQPPELQLQIRANPPMCHGGLGSVSAYATGGSGSYSFNWNAQSAGAPKVLLRPASEPIFLDAPTSVLMKLRNAEAVCQGTGSHLNMGYSPSHSGYCSLSLFSAGTSSTAGLYGCPFCFDPAQYNKLVFWVFSDSADLLNGLSIAFTTGANWNTVGHISIRVWGQLVANQWSKVEVPYEILGDTTTAEGISFKQSSNTTGRVLIDSVSVLTRDSIGAGFGVASGFESAIEVTAADYILTVVDGNGCSSNNTIITVVQPEAIKIVQDVVPPTGEGLSDGRANVNAVGGVSPYTYIWEGQEQPNGEISNLSAGVHHLIVRDANGCEVDFQLFVDRYVAPVYLRPYNSKLSSGLAALVGIGFLLSIFSATMLYRYWVSFSTLGSFLSSMILVGCVLSFLSALVLLPAPTDALCTSFIWFLGIGFVLVYGCLFIKTWALYQVWRNAVRYQKANLTPIYIVKCLCLAVLVEVIFLAIWTAIDPPRARQMQSLNNSLELQCNSKHITFWIIFLAVKGLWLVFGAVLSVLTRNIAKEINESSSIAYAIYNNVLLGAIAIPLALLLGEVPGGRLTVIVVIISVAFSFTMVVVFFKIWHSIMLPEKIIVSSNEMRSKRNTVSSTGQSTASLGRTNSKSSPGTSAKASSSDSDAAV